MSELFHYCSNAALISIITNNSIWLSSLSGSNDYLEGKVVFRLFDELSRKNNLDERVISEVNILLEHFLDTLDAFGLCLSEQGDLLNQWRAYAEDGKGVSIGFNKDYLETWAKNNQHQDSEKVLTLDKIIYQYNKQNKLLKPIFNELLSVIENGVLEEMHLGTLLTPKSDIEIENEKNKYVENRQKLFITLIPMIGLMYKFKNECFFEEREWRLKTFYAKGEDFEENIYRSQNDRIIPYEVMLMPDLKKNIISKIVIGPKNKTPELVIKSLLKSKGFNNVEIKRSNASYR